MKLTYIENEPHTSREKYEKLKSAPLAEQRFKFFGGDIEFRISKHYSKR